MGIFYNLRDLYNIDLTRAIIITIGLLIILGLTIWVSVIDLKKKSITFWKMLIVGFSILIIPIIGAFFCGCYLLKFILLLSIPIYIFFLFINIKFNNDKFIGKGDMDILYSIFSLMISYSIWLYITSDDKSVFAIRLGHAWYLLFLYLLIGGLIFILLTIINFVIRKVFLGQTFKELVRTQVPVIAMFIPACITMPLLVMVS